MRFYEVIVKSNGIDQNSGKEKVITERFILEAETFGDAENTIYGIMDTRDFEIVNINPKKWECVLGEGESEVYFLAVIASLDIDEQTGKEKWFNRQIIIASDTIEGAKTIADDDVSKYITTAQLTKLQETKITNYVK